MPHPRKSAQGEAPIRIITSGSRALSIEIDALVINQPSRACDKLHDSVERSMLAMKGTPRMVTKVEFRACIYASKFIHKRHALSAP